MHASADHHVPPDLGALPPVPVRRIELRYALVIALVDARCPLTVQELHQALLRRGLCVHGRPGKVISDALRTEVARGRVHRVGRGRYRAGAIRRQTRWRMRTRIMHRLAVGSPSDEQDADAAVAHELEQDLGREGPDVAERWDGAHTIVRHVPNDGDAG